MNWLGMTADGNVTAHPSSLRSFSFLPLLSSLFIFTRHSSFCRSPLVVSLASFTSSFFLSAVVQAELCDSAAVAESSRRERQRQTQEGGADDEGRELPG